MLPRRARVLPRGPAAHTLPAPPRASAPPGLRPLVPQGWGWASCPLGWALRGRRLPPRLRTRRGVASALTADLPPNLHLLAAGRGSPSARSGSLGDPGRPAPRVPWTGPSRASARPLGSIPPPRANPDTRPREARPAPGPSSTPTPGGDRAAALPAPPWLLPLERTWCECAAGGLVSRLWGDGGTQPARALRGAGGPAAGPRDTGREALISRECGHCPSFRDPTFWGGGKGPTRAVSEPRARGALLLSYV